MKKPEQNSGRHARQRGGIMLLALFVLAAGSFGMAAWVGLLGARSTASESQLASIERRIVLGNSRAMAREYTFRNVLTASSGAGETTPVEAADATTAKVWGAFTMGAFTEAPLGSTDLTAGMNRFSPANNNYGYFVPLDVALSDGSSFTSARFYAKSRSPVLGGCGLFVGRSVEAPDEAIHIAYEAGAPTSNYLEVEGTSYYTRPSGAAHQYKNRTVFFDARHVAVTSPAMPVPFAPPHSSGTGVAQMTNFPSIPMTSGSAGANLGYDGSMNVVDAPGQPQSLKDKVLAAEYLSSQTVNGTTAFDSRGVSGAGDGTITIDLGDILLQNIYVESGVDTIEFLGQEDTAATDDDYDRAARYPAVLVVVAQPATNLTSVNFHEQNNRRLVVAVKNPGYQRLDWVWMEADDASGTPKRLDYRLLLTVENTFVDFTFPGNVADVHLHGGFHTSRKVIAASASEKMYIHSEVINPGSSNTAAFAERYAPRVAWLETFVP